MNPNVCYCLECRIPIDPDLSRRQGMCDACLAARTIAQQAEISRSEAQAAAQARAEADRKAAVYSTDTGLGVCAGCGSRSIVESVNREDAGMGCAAQSLVILFGFAAVALFLVSFLVPLLFLLSLPMIGFLLLAVVLEPKGRQVRRRTCRVCGHAWRV